MRKAVIAIMVMFTLPAHAQWYFQGEESAFGGNSVSVIFTGAGSYGFGVRCEGDTLLAIFKTPDRSFDEDTLNIANATQPTLLARIDDHDPFELNGILSQLDEEVWVRAEITPEFVSQLEEAQSGISVAVKMLDEIYHETKFSTIGSTANAKKLKNVCPAARVAEASTDD